MGMFGFGYLMVPMYNIICDITGLNGKTSSVAVSAPGISSEVSNRMVTVEFVAVVNSAAAWKFKPMQRTMQVVPGQTYNASFEAINLSSADAVGQAVPSVAPSSAAKYFNKIECFCFTRQEFESRATKELPLIFFISEDLPRSIDTVTLSYTYFDTGETKPNSTDS